MQLSSRTLFEILSNLVLNQRVLYGDTKQGKVVSWSDRQRGASTYLFVRFKSSHSAGLLLLKCTMQQVEEHISSDDTPSIVLAPCHSAEYLLIPVGNEQMFSKNGSMHVCQRTVSSFMARMDDINDVHQSSYG